MAIQNSRGLQIFIDKHQTVTTLGFEDYIVFIETT